jgi:hypothetical protein
MKSSEHTEQQSDGVGRPQAASATAESHLERLPRRQVHQEYRAAERTQRPHEHVGERRASPEQRSGYQHDQDGQDEDQNRVFRNSRSLVVRRDPVSARRWRRSRSSCRGGMSLNVTGWKPENLQNKEALQSLLVCAWRRGSAS